MDIELAAQKFYDYSNYMRGYSPDTIARYKKVIDFYRKFNQINLIEEITEENINALFINGRTERNWKPRTFIVYYHSLIVFFRWCVVNKLMSDNPIINIEFPKVEKRLPKKLNKQDALKILEVAFSHYWNSPFLAYRNHAIFAMFVFAGLRKQELLRLKITDVDIVNLSIFINQGKGSKDRIVPMSNTLASHLKPYLEWRKRLNKSCPQFFVSQSRDTGFTKDGLKHLVAIMNKASNIKFSVHKLRHTFATLMLEGGCDIYSLSRMMGHSDIKTTAIYLSASAEHLRSQVSKHPLNVWNE